MEYTQKHTPRCIVRNQFYRPPTLAQIRAQIFKHFTDLLRVRIWNLYRLHQTAKKRIWQISAHQAAHGNVFLENYLNWIRIHPTYSNRFRNFVTTMSKQRYFGRFNEFICINLRRIQYWIYLFGGNFRYSGTADECSWIECLFTQNMMISILSYLLLTNVCQSNFSLLQNTCTCVFKPST